MGNHATEARFLFQRQVALRDDRAKPTANANQSGPQEPQVAGPPASDSLDDDLHRILDGAVAWLHDKHAPISATGIVTAVCATRGYETCRIVREHLVDIGLLPPA